MNGEEWVSKGLHTDVLRKPAGSSGQAGTEGLTEAELEIRWAT